MCSAAQPRSAHAHTWPRSQADELHWPLLVLYPEPAQSDFVQDHAESEPLQPLLDEMFGKQGERSPPWDTERQYASTRLAVYVPLGSSAAEEGVIRIAPQYPLLAQLKRAQAIGYEIPGVPVVQVVVTGSEYEKRFLTPHVKSGTF